MNAEGAWDKPESGDLFDNPEALAKVMAAEPIEGEGAEEEDGDRTPPPGSYTFSYNDGEGEGEYAGNLDDAGEDEFEPQGSLGGFGNMTLKGLSFGNLDDEGDAVDEPPVDEANEEADSEMLEIDEEREATEKDRQAAMAVIASVTGSVMSKLRASASEDDDDENDKLVEISPIEVENHMYDDEEEEDGEGEGDVQDVEVEQGASSFMFTTGKLELRSVNNNKAAHDKDSDEKGSSPDADSIGADGEGDTLQFHDKSNALKIFEGSHARENYAYGASSEPHPLAEDDEDNVETDEVKISIDISKEQDDDTECEAGPVTGTEVVDLELGDDEDNKNEARRAEAEEIEAETEDLAAVDADADSLPPPALGHKFNFNVAPTKPKAKPEPKQLPNRFNKSAKVGSGAFRDLLVYAVGAKDQFARKTKGFTEVADMIQKRELINESWSYQARLKKHHQMQPGQPLPPVLQLPRLAKPLDPSNSATNANKINEHGQPACASDR